MHLRQAHSHESSAEASASFAHMGQDIDNLRSRVSTEHEVHEKLAKMNATTDLESVASGNTGTDAEEPSDDEGEGMFDGMLKSFGKEAKLPASTVPRKRAKGENAFTLSKRPKSMEVEVPEKMETHQPGSGAFGGGDQTMRSAPAPRDPKRQKVQATPKPKAAGAPVSATSAAAFKALKTWDEKQTAFSDDQDTDPGSALEVPRRRCEQNHYD